MIPRVIVTTVRPMPGRRAPAAAGSLVVLLALPVFAVAGWSLGAWVLAAVLWTAGEALGFALGRLPLSADHLVSSGVIGVAMSLRAIVVMAVLLAVAVSNASLALAALLLYVAAYSVELGASLLLYFVSKP